MPYPISIKKKAKINLENSIKYEDIINGLSKDLIKSGNEIEIIGNKIRIVSGPEFSAKTSFKEFNKGHIDLDKTDNKVKVSIKIYLIEHLIAFFIVFAMATYGLIEKGYESAILKVALLLLMASFVFCYLMPLMTLNSYIKKLTNRT
ncbi:hypothetical protein [Echinicola salinicaeni]|uniref:hypothetical protein n=1 Tax=Echinicola salinicaeni TaxID=2762757 RepID=UPI001647D8D1|nr:hypothetical protein [Echinicola salinicaeni]